MPIVGMLRRVRLRAILDRNFRKCFAAAKICVRNSVRSRRKPCRRVVRSLLGTLGGPKHLCRRASACCGACDCVRFSADFRPKFSKNFRCHKIFRSKSLEIAPKSMPLGCAQHAHDPQRSPTTVPSVGMLRRVNLRAVRCRFPTEIFENFSRPQNFSFEIA